MTKIAKAREILENLGSIKAENNGDLVSEFLSSYAHISHVDSSRFNVAKAHCLATASTNFTSVSDASSYQEAIRKHIEAAQTAGFSGLPVLIGNKLNANPNHWVSLTVEKKENSLTITFFSSLPGYDWAATHFEKIVRDLDPKAQFINATPYKSHSENGYAQKDRVSCAYYVSMYQYLISRQQTTKRFSLDDKNDRLFYELIGEEAKACIERLQNNHSTPLEELKWLNTTHAGWAMDLRALEFINIVRASEYITKESLKAHLESLSSLDLNDPTVATLIVSLLLLSTGLTLHVALANVIGIIGTTATGVNLLFRPNTNDVIEILFDELAPSAELVNTY